MTILVTGGAGFIGSALARRLADSGHHVVVVDNFNDYYDVALKEARATHFLEGIAVIRGDFTDAVFLESVFSQYQIEVVCHLAAYAGVRFSVEHPELYAHTNIAGLVTLLEVMRRHNCSRIVFASSSSVYGNNSPVPFTEMMAADQPESVYGASKRAGELLLHSYFVLHHIQATCLRFFTVYGPWSRPDMAMLLFAKQMMKEEPINVFNHGNLRRDFTYIDDIVSGFMLAVQKPLGYEVLNLGRGNPVALKEYILLLEAALGKKARQNLLPMQPGDVFETYADITKATELLGFVPQVTIDEGIRAFAEWFLEQEGA